MSTIIEVMADWIRSRLASAFSGCFSEQGWLLSCFFPSHARSKTRSNTSSEVENSVEFEKCSLEETVPPPDSGVSSTEFTAHSELTPHDSSSSKDGASLCSCEHDETDNTSGHGTMLPTATLCPDDQTVEEAVTNEEPAEFLTETSQHSEFHSCACSPQSSQDSTYVSLVYSEQIVCSPVETPSTTTFIKHLEHSQSDDSTSIGQCLQSEKLDSYSNIDDYCASVTELDQKEMVIMRFSPILFENKSKTNADHLNNNAAIPGLDRYCFVDCDELLNKVEMNNPDVFSVFESNELDMPEQSIKYSLSLHEEHFVNLGSLDECVRDCFDECHVDDTFGDDGLSESTMAESFVIIDDHELDHLISSAALAAVEQYKSSSLRVALNTLHVELQTDSGCMYSENICEHVNLNSKVLADHTYTSTPCLNDHPITTTLPRNQVFHSHTINTNGHESFDIPEQCSCQPRDNKSLLTFEEIADETCQKLLNDALKLVIDIKQQRKLSESDVNAEYDSIQDESIPSQMLSSDLIAMSSLPGAYEEFYENNFESDEWLDDDFGFNNESLTVRSPPPYPDVALDETVIASFTSFNPEQLRSTLSELVEPCVPTSTDEVLGSVHQAVDVFWECRRYGEPWDTVLPPSTYFTAEEETTTLEGSSRRAYKKLLFDLVAELLFELYRDDEPSETPPWLPHRLQNRQPPPTTLTVLKSVIDSHILVLLGASLECRRAPRKWFSRRKDDVVDRLLVEELGEEEPDWVDYEVDKVTRKNQIADLFFDALIVDTMRTMADISRYRHSAARRYVIAIRVTSL